MNEVLPYARGFVVGYIVYAFIPTPYAPALMLFVCSILILSGLGVFR